MIDRRTFLLASLPWTLALTGRVNAATDGSGALPLGPPTPFSFEHLVDRARQMAQQPWQAPTSPGGDFFDKVDFDAVQKITFRPQDALWRGEPDRLPVRFFHLHRFVPVPVTIHVVEGDQAREIRYDRSLFDYADSGLAAKLPDGLGFAGFRVMDSQHSESDWLAFQGATYFRSSGEDGQYGASARGIAANTATSTKEEFPRFTSFWLDAPPSESADIIVHALLDGPSLTGAYRFRAAREHGAMIDVHAELFIRNPVARLGIAPLTSMYWYGENDHRNATDWRPEIHDSDGLAIWNGRGERIFRPLVNPPTVQVNSFVDENPKGFGLMQRDRKFDHYQDDGAFYERRPGIWVEPLAAWGKGAVQLVEIPTNDEIHDNIVAFWKPAGPVERGDRLALDYRLHWRNRQPFPPANIATVVATRKGHGGIPGQRHEGDEGTKFVIDFAGGPLAEMAARYDLKPEVTASRGTVDNAYSVKVVDTDMWRVAFDLRVDGKEPVDLRCLLRLDDRPLTETWLYQFFPQA